MKVDSAKIAEAHDKMTILLAKCEQIEEQIKQVQYRLRELEFGSRATTASMDASLRSQRRTIGERVDGLGRLRNVLQFAENEYRRCEGEIEKNVQTPGNQRGQNSVADLFVSNKEKYNKTEFIVPDIVESELIDRYIRPLIAGKKGRV